MKQVDFAIIGGGSAGLTAMRQIRKHSENFLLVSETWGTTCASVGCMPSKAFIEPATALHRARAFGEMGLEGAAGLRADIPAIMRQVRRLRDDFTSGPASVVGELGERAVTGRARLLGPDRIEVGGEEIGAKAIILAPGSAPIVPGPWRDLGARLVTTDDFFEREDLPGRVGVIGLGAIGAELAFAMARLGIEVCAVDAAQTLAGITDPEVAGAARDILCGELDARFGVEARLTATESGVEIAAGETSREVDLVLAAIGRRPNLEGLGLETLGLGLEDGEVPEVDPGTLRLGDVPVWLAGDANGFRPLLHEASDDGFIAARNALGEAPRGLCRRTPLAIAFTHPDIARIGESFEALEGEDIVIGARSFGNQGRARIERRNSGLIRVYADRATGRPRGAELCAPAGEHLAHLLALAIERGLSAADMLAAPVYHPTLEEGLRSALREISAQIENRGTRSDLADCPRTDFATLD